jgi:hypothetical protein
MIFYLTSLSLSITIISALSDNKDRLFVIKRITNCLGENIKNYY